jgi:patatin-like phospholipase/acyl hydrolase
MKDVINVLSIDGGGIRGVLPAEILVYVEKKLSELYNKEIKLSDHFDYVAGTSTGGILGALYCFPDENGNPKYSAQQASDLYMNYGSHIFKKEFRYFSTLNGMFGPRYRPNNLEGLFSDYFKDVRIKESTSDFMLTSIDTTQRDIYFFKSYKAKLKEPHNLMFREAVRSTSAAPTYFRPSHLIIDGIDRCLIDGGMGINNPTVSAYIEVKKLYPNAKKINVLSIGTGPLELPFLYRVAKKWGILDASKIFDINLNSMSDAVDYQMNNLYKEGNLVGDYLRVSPKLIKGTNSKMDSASKKNLQMLKDSAKRSLENSKDDIDNFLKNSLS